MWRSCGRGVRLGPGGGPEEPEVSQVAAIGGLRGHGPPSERRRQTMHRPAPTGADDHAHVVGEGTDAAAAPGVAPGQAGDRDEEEPQADHSLATPPVRQASSEAGGEGSFGPACLRSERDEWASTPVL